MLLPINLKLPQLQTLWKSILDPLLSNPLNSGQQLTQISLAIGSNTINHKLGRKLQGWMVTGINGASTIYDLQSTNSAPERTLMLHSSAAVTINLYVF